MKSRKRCLVLSGVSFLWLPGKGGKANLTFISPSLVWTWAATVGEKVGPQRKVLREVT